MSILLFGAYGVAAPVTGSYHLPKKIPLAEAYLADPIEEELLHMVTAD
jgi:hypothetical protein